MQHFAFLNTDQLEEVANRPCNFLSTPPKEYNKIIQAKAEVLIRNIRLQPIQERHHGFLSTLAESRRLNVKCLERDNRKAWRDAYNASKRPLREVGRSFEPFTLEEMK